MKHLSIVLNFLLVIAVAILYFLHFSNKKAVEKKERPIASLAAGSGAARPAIAYVDLDSLNEKIRYIKNRRKDLEAEQQAIEAEWEGSYRNLENQKNNFLKKGSSISQDEAQKFQADLLQQQQIVDEKKQSLTQKLTERSYKFMEDIQKKLKDFLEDYNTEKNYMYIFTTGTGLDYMVYKDSSLNITADVIEGMNAKLKAAGLQ